MTRWLILVLLAGTLAVVHLAPVPRVGDNLEQRAADPLVTCVVPLSGNKAPVLPEARPSSCGHDLGDASVMNRITAC
ncbi:MAG: hypothetical protein HY216_10275 [Candidatus Rokubacteria bacterium]|nr:hypothetical protein [Candidatus Rokubacteria bacterium]